jgi:two-component system alkaline phosphatase synthesis response regulator PhoP
MAHRILVIDDDRQIVRAVRTYLEEAGMITFAAYSGEEALRVIQYERPHLMVLDLMLPDGDGWDLTRRIRGDKRYANIAILMLTARVEDHDKIVGLQIGADDYLTKPFNPLEVVARVQAILRRVNGSLTAPHVIEIRGLRLDVDSRVVAVAGSPVDLTATEFTLLQLLMENPNHVFTRAALVQRVLGYAYEGMERTIDAHVKNVRKKIEPDPAQPQYIETVYGVGYRLREERA